MGKSILAQRGIFRRRYRSHSTGLFKSLIAGSDTPDLCASNSFVASALRAAKGTQTSHRRIILTDVASVLSCSADELDFLFNDPIMAANDSDPVAMPDYRASLLKGQRAFAR